MCAPKFLIGNRNPFKLMMGVNTYEPCWDSSLTIRIFYMFMFSCYLFIRLIRKLKYEIHFNFISSDPSCLISNACFFFRSGFFKIKTI